MKNKIVEQEYAKLIQTILYVHVTLKKISNAEESSANTAKTI